MDKLAPDESRALARATPKRWQMKILVHAYSAIELTPRGMLDAASERLAIARIEPGIKSSINSRINLIKIGKHVERVILSLELSDRNRIITLPTFPPAEPWADLGTYSFSRVGIAALTRLQSARLVADVAFACALWRQKASPRGRSPLDCATDCLSSDHAYSAAALEFFRSAVARSVKAKGHRTEQQERR